MADPTLAHLLELQRAQAGLAAVVERRLNAVLAQLVEQAGDPRQLRDAIIGVTQLMIREHGQAAGVMAADWYARTRRAAGIVSPFTPGIFVPDFSQQAEATVRRVIGPLFEGTKDLTSAIDSITAKAAEYVVDGARETVRRNTNRDPRSSGWRRVAIGETCDFCLMLVGRGGVYKRDTVRFKSHTRCNCAAAPSWDPNAPEVPTEAYEASARTSSMTREQRQAMNERLQAYIEQNRVELDALRESLAQ